jgi:hypothetical protein
MAHRPDYESADYKEGYEDGKREATKQWRSLSDAEIEELYGDCSIEYFRDIEKALREKNNG